MPEDRPRRLTLSLELPHGVEVQEALEAVAEQVDDDDFGYAPTSGGDVSWRLRTPGDGAPLDPRQRTAAALLVSAVDVPCDMLRYATTMLEAADIDPGMKVGEIGSGQRVANLREARRLVDEMIAEADAAGASS